MREDLAVGAAMHIMVDSAESTATADARPCAIASASTLPFVVRWNPVRRFTSWRTVEPYVRGVGRPLDRARTTR